MATLTVWTFDTATGADDAEDILRRLDGDGLINIHDAATVSWPEGRKKPKTRQMHSATSGGALGGAFWGLLFGLLFFIPFLGAAIGATMGGIAGALTDVGIDDEFLDSVRAQVKPGTSALFLMSSDAVLDAVRGAFADSNPHLLRTNLTDDEEDRLREVFAEG
jgi:uncharacterized membrane protein